MFRRNDSRKRQPSFENNQWHSKSYQSNESRSIRVPHESRRRLSSGSSDSDNIKLPRHSDDGNRWQLQRKESRSLRTFDDAGRRPFRYSDDANRRPPRYLDGDKQRLHRSPKKDNGGHDDNAWPPHSSQLNEYRSFRGSDDGKLSLCRSSNYDNCRKPYSFHRNESQSDDAAGSLMRLSERNDHLPHFPEENPRQQHSFQSDEAGRNLTRFSKYDNQRPHGFPDEDSRWQLHSFQRNESRSDDAGISLTRFSEGENRRFLRSPDEDNRRPPTSLRGSSDVNHWQPQSSARNDYQSFREIDDGNLRFSQSSNDDKRCQLQSFHRNEIRSNVADESLIRFVEVDNRRLPRSSDEDNRSHSTGDNYRWQTFSSHANGSQSFRGSEYDEQRHIQSQQKESNKLEKISHKTRNKAIEINKKFSKMHPNDLSEPDREVWRWARKILRDHRRSKMGEEPDTVSISLSEYTKVRLPKIMRTPKRKYKPGEAIPVYTMTLGLVDRGILDGSIPGKKWNIFQAAFQSVCHPSLRNDSASRRNYDDNTWFRKRIKQIKFTDGRTMNLYEEALEEIGELWPGAKLELVPIDELLLIIRYVASVPTTTRDTEEVTKIIKTSNPHFPTDWMITELKKTESESYLKIFLFLGEESKNAWAKTDRSLYYGFGTIIVARHQYDKKTAAATRAAKGISTEKPNVIDLCDDDGDSNLESPSMTHFRHFRKPDNQELSLALAVIDHNSGITADRWFNLQSRFLALYWDILRKDPGPPPQCNDSSWHGSYLKIIKCADERSVNLYKKVFSCISGDIWPGAKLELVNFKDLPERPRAFSWIPGGCSRPYEILDVLRSSNPTLPMHDWWIENMGKKIVNGRKLIEFRINDVSLQMLRLVEGKANYQSEVVVISSNLNTFSL